MADQTDANATQTAPLSIWLGELKHRGVRLWADGDRLVYEAAPDALKPGDIERLRIRKREIIESLRRKRSTELQALSSGEKVGLLPVSFGQERLLFLLQLGLMGSAYNVAVEQRIQGLLNCDALERSFNEIIRRHETLRTRFVISDGVSNQVIDEPSTFQLEVHELSQLETAERQRQLDTIRHQHAHRQFNVECEPLFSATLVRLGTESHVLLITTHHLVCDGWSMGILLQELSALYEAYSAGCDSPLDYPSLQYVDFVMWQRRGMNEEEDLNYWRQYLTDAPILPLVTDRPRSTAPMLSGSAVTFDIPSTVLRPLREEMRAEGITLYMMLLSAFQLLLAFYCDQSDILIGSPTAGRNRREFEGLIGFFLVTLVIRTKIDRGESFRQLLRRVRSDVLEAHKHSNVRFERLVTELQPNREFERQPLFRTLFSLLNLPSRQVKTSTLDICTSSVELSETALDLSLVVEEQSQFLRCRMEYAVDIFDRETIERLVSHFKHLLQWVAQYPDTFLSELHLLTEAEKQCLLVQWNATESRYQNEECLHDLIVQAARRCPEQIALLDGGVQTTFAELDERSNQLAMQLRDMGAGPEAVVAILLPRSSEMVIAMIAVLKAGAAFLCCDVGYPADRLNYMLKDSGARILLTKGDWLQQLPKEQAATVFLIDSQSVAGSSDAEGRSNSDVSPAGLAYVVYTSGSTGSPKGIWATHRATVNRLRAQSDIESWSFHTCCQKTSSGFVDFVAETLGPLTMGCTLAIASEDVASDPEALGEFISTSGVTCLLTVPSLARILLEAPLASERLRKLRSWTLSGESFDVDLINRLTRLLPQCRFINLYGSSEVAADVTWYSCSGQERQCVPIGRPIRNTQLFVLDRCLMPVPVGVPGELYVAGDGLARGYVRQPGLTAQRFIANPYGRPGSRLFRTGDRVRYRMDGTLEYLGRKDQQVKIRGNRVELGEIEERMRDYPGIREAVVLAREDGSGGRRLVAYYTVLNNADVSAEALRSSLSCLLPRYMIPAAYVALPALPMTLSGKLDRRALPLPNDQSYVTRVYEPPGGALESALAEIWRDVLQIDRVGRHDNFFELGGHSLLSMKLVSRIADELGIQLSVQKLFRHPSVGQLAVHIEGLPGANSRWSTCSSEIEEGLI